jgi:hypothetical protein
MKTPTKLLFIVAAFLPGIILISNSKSATENIGSALNSMPSLAFAALPSLLVFMCALMAKSKIFTLLSLGINILLTTIYIRVLFEPLGGFAYGGIAIFQLILSFALMPISYLISEARG